LRRTLASSTALSSLFAKKLPFMPKHKEQFLNFNIISLPLPPVYYLLAIAACAAASLAIGTRNGEHET